MQTPTCSQKNCRRPVDRRADGGFYRSCAKCKARRAAWQRNREKERNASGKCRACGRPRERKPDGSLFDRCARCRKRRLTLLHERTKAGMCSCGKPRDVRPDGKLYARCPSCRTARAKRRAELVEQGGCKRCHYRAAAEGDDLCPPCRKLAPKRAARKRKQERSRPARQRRRKMAYDRPAGPRIPDALKCRNSRCNGIRHEAKPDGTLYATCTKCRRVRRERRAELVEQGGCKKCGYRRPEPGGTRCTRCREAKDAFNAEVKELRRISREIDQWAAKPEPRKYEPTGEERGISRWNSRKPREANGLYWSPNPDPKPRERDPDARGPPFHHRRPQDLRPRRLPAMRARDLRRRPAGLAAGARRRVPRTRPGRAGRPGQRTPALSLDTVPAPGPVIACEHAVMRA